MSDAEYREYVSCRLNKVRHNPKVEQWLKDNFEPLLSVFLLDFEPIHDKLAGLYSQRESGKRPYDPQVILRSLLLMVVFGFTSITKWARHIKTDSKLALFCGTTPEQMPAEGTYYAFFKRLENGPYQEKCPHRVLASQQRAAKSRLRPPKTKPKEKPKIEEKEIGVIKKLVQEVIARENEPLARDLETLLNEILLLCAVKPSAEKELIKDPSKISAGGDGSTMPSASACNGKPTCDCRKQGIYDCDHMRYFSDPNAKWGWDNREKDFIFGYRFYQMVVGDNGHSLPIYLSMDSANTHEAVMAIEAIDRFGKLCRVLYPIANIKEMSFDALFDIYAFYEYLIHKSIDYAIPYANEPAKCLSLGQDEQLFNDKGIPICPAGLAMAPLNKDKQGRKVYHCPAKRITRKDGKMVRELRRDRCPLEAICEPDTKLGPLVHVREDIDYRIHPPITRGSKKYKELQNMRGCCERSNSMKKYTYNLKTTRTRVMSYAFIRTALISLLEHSKVWAREINNGANLNKISVFDLFC